MRDYSSSGWALRALALAWAVALPLTALAGQRGPITDPFGDPGEPSQPAEEEPSHPEKAAPTTLPTHMGLGIDLGVAGFTGGLGRTTSSGLYFGAHYLYFLSHALALEGGVHYSHHTDTVHGANISTGMLPISLAARYYIFTHSGSSVVHFLNPFLVAGAGIYIRNQNVVSTGGLKFDVANSTTNNFAMQGGLGTETNLFKGKYFFGVDFRYHYVFFNDKDSTFSGAVAPGSRAGDYYTINASLTYHF